MANKQRPNALLWQRSYAAEQVPIIAQRFLLQGDYQLHSHDFVELVLIISGTSQHLSNSGERTLKAGDIIALRPGAWHAYLQCQHLAVYNCCFSVELLQNELYWLSADPVLQQLFGSGPLLTERHGLLFLAPGEATMQESLQHLDAIYRLKQRNSRQEKLAIIGHLLLFLTLLRTCLAQEAGEQGAQQLPPRVLQGMNLLAEHLTFPWTLTELAAQLGLERSYLVRLFSKHRGLSPMAYLGHLRMERALDLLVHSDLSIGEIGRQIGWPDPRQFSRSFKAHMGMSAQSYKTKFFGAGNQPDQTHHR